MHLHTHDPFRGAQASAPQICPDTEPLMRPLRLVAWVDRYPPWRGSMAGGELMLHGILRQLVDRGHQVAVCTHAHPGGEPIVFRGVDVYPESEAPRLLDDVDVLVSHLLWTKHARAAAVRGQIPFVYLFHNDFTIAPWNLRPSHVTATVFNTRWLRAATHKRYKLWEQVPSVVVRPPVNPEAFEVRGPAFEREYITLVNPNQAKGGQQFYEIAERRRQLRFLAVEGAYGQQIRPRRGVHKHVEWQPQTPEMLADVYARTRVLLVPSDYESFGLAAAEAAASGAVVIASDTLGLREALGPGGLFAPARNVDRWLAWLDAIADREVYENAAGAQRDHVASLGRVGVGEIDALERILRLAANAERVISPAMGGHDPFRKHGRSVEVGEAPQSPQEPPEPVPAGVGADGAETATQAAQAAEDERPAMLAEPTPEMVAAAERAGMDTQQGAGVDGETAGGDAGHTPDGEGREALTSETVAPGDGAPSHDEGQPSPEPAPATTGPVPGDAAQPPDPGAEPTAHAATVDTSDDPDRPALAAQVPDNATGDDGIVAWIGGASTPAEAYDRAEAAEWVENQRPKAGRKKRKAVIAAIEPILYED
jgi:glycosyltransferase involved in cell wall biosynthesis